MSNLKKLSLVSIIFIVLVSLTGCGDGIPTAESDSFQNFDVRTKPPVDKNIYTITGTVVGDITSKERQIRAASGSLTAVDGIATGTYYGPQYTGRGIVRLQVESVNPSTVSLSVGEVAILKTGDLKAVALLIGDKVQFKCRRDAEAIAAVVNNEEITAKHIVWEMDYCRLAVPNVKLTEGR